MTFIRKIQYTHNAYFIDSNHQYKIENRRYITSQKNRRPDQVGGAGMSTEKGIVETSNAYYIYHEMQIHIRAIG